LLNKVAGGADVLPMLSTHTHESRPIVEVGRLAPSVILVDDDEQFRDLARQILEPAGYRVIEARNVAECMSRLRCEAVDAIILDIVMPDRDGIEAIDDLRRLSPKSPIVTVSGASHSELYLKLSDYEGADASLRKADIACLAPLLDLLLER
jgi:CheY-like chemotaxis protein